MRKPKLRPAVDLPDQSWMRDAACYARGRALIDGTDEVAREMEAKWGVDRLRCLVDDDLRARFDGQRIKFHEAVRVGELDDLERECPRMRRAWVALDKAAEAAGAQRPSLEAWEVALPGGGVAAIVRDRDGYPAAQAAGRNVQVFELEEIARLIAGFPEIVQAKEMFPGATVVAVSPRSDPLREMEFSDDIPFGDGAQ